jgi:hypothetical protein
MAFEGALDNRERRVQKMDHGQELLTDTMVLLR